MVSIAAIAVIPDDGAFRLSRLYYDGIKARDYLRFSTKMLSHSRLELSRSVFLGEVHDIPLETEHQCREQ